MNTRDLSTEYEGLKLRCLNDNDLFIEIDKELYYYIIHLYNQFPINNGFYYGGYTVIKLGDPIIFGSYSTIRKDGFYLNGKLITKEPK